MWCAKIELHMRKWQRCNNICLKERTGLVVKGFTGEVTFELNLNGWVGVPQAENQGGYLGQGFSISALFCCVGLSFVLYDVSSIPGVHLLNASGIISLSCHNQIMSPDMAKCPPGAKLTALGTHCCRQKQPHVQGWRCERTTL